MKFDVEFCVFFFFVGRTILTLLSCFIMQLSKIDAQILQNVTGMQQLEVKLEPVSAHDYRSILLPLVKSYMRVCVKM